MGDGRVRLGTVGCDGVVAHMPPPGAVLRVSAFHPDGSFDEGEVLTLGAYAP